MARTDRSEKELESTIVRAMTGRVDLLNPPHTATGSTAPVTGGTGWLLGDPKHFDRAYCVDLVQLRGFIEATQPTLVDALGLASDGPTRRAFLARLQGEVKRRGVVDVMRKGIDHGVDHVDLFYSTPSPGNAEAAERFRQNRFSVVRQLHYSASDGGRALDLGLFVNGLPVFTVELKNRLTGQTVADAVEQYKRDRDPREVLFHPGRCLAHLAVSDVAVRFCTVLDKKASWFLPFDQGHDGGAGNPPRDLETLPPGSSGLATAYLWEEVLTPASLTDIIENYAQMIEVRSTGRSSRRGRRKPVFPRYHQLRVVRRLLDDVGRRGAGQRYLIQHSAGSGKSMSIAWLVHQLGGVRREGERVFDSVIVVTDRRVLDRQIRDTIKQFVQVRSTVGHAERSGDLRKFIAAGKSIIITTVQKFPFVLDEIGSAHRDRRFAIVIDEAHSSQGGKTAAALNVALSGGEADPDETTEDRINRIIEEKRMLSNASYFAFTATPKNKTLEKFGERVEVGGEVRFRPFDTYSMKQAIQEGFILDVLQHFTPVDSYYKLIKTVDDDPEFDTKRAQKKLRRYVEGDRRAIAQKAEIMLDHFQSQVLARHKIGGQARAMVVCAGIERAVRYYGAFNELLKRRHSPYRAIVAFSDEHTIDGVKVTEASLNGFPGSQIEEQFREDPYRFLICADKFQTGYDEPLLHTMYVDKTLSSIKAVQTLSRLNRAHPKKRDVFVLDFVNKVDTIQQAFERYYRTTLLVGETDINRLNDLMAELAMHEVYSAEEVDALVELFLEGADRDRLDPILDGCAAVYVNTLDEEAQVDFKGKAKAFLRAYGFLASILPRCRPGWEKLSIFLEFLVPKLPAPVDTDLSRGILETIDMDNYRAEKRATQRIALTDEDGEILPVPVGGGGSRPEPELDVLSRIVESFNALFGNIPWSDPQRVQTAVTEEIPESVRQDSAYAIARVRPDEQNARVELQAALWRVLIARMADDAQLFKQWSDNEDFQRWLIANVFALTYEGGRGSDD